VVGRSGNQWYAARSSTDRFVNQSLGTWVNAGPNARFLVGNFATNPPTAANIAAAVSDDGPLHDLNDDHGGLNGTSDDSHTGVDDSGHHG
ncbi:MAG: hypothetical protein KDB23_26385, partial [Planctomycetales bacterium]|nr:hypothetical protein [Planctomycetales bacterium]